MSQTLTEAIEAALYEHQPLVHWECIEDACQCGKSFRVYSRDEDMTSDRQAQAAHQREILMDIVLNWPAA